MPTDVQVAKINDRAAMRRDVVELARAVFGNPLAAGLTALVINQLLYKARVWDPRPSADGKYRTWKSKWGLDKDGLHLGDSVYAEADPEQIGSDTATVIGAAILAATLAYAGKAQQVLPIMAVK